MFVLVFLCSVFVVLSVLDVSILFLVVMVSQGSLNTRKRSASKQCPGSASRSSTVSSRACWRKSVRVGWLPASTCSVQFQRQRDRDRTRDAKAISKAEVCPHGAVGTQRRGLTTTGRTARREEGRVTTEVRKEAAVAEEEIRAATTTGDTLAQRTIQTGGNNRGHVPRAQMFSKHP